MNPENVPLLFGLDLMLLRAFHRCEVSQKCPYFLYRQNHHSSPTWQSDIIGSIAFFSIQFS